MNTAIISLLIGVFFTLVGFKIYKPKLSPKTDPKKWENNLTFFKIVGILSLGWSAFQHFL